MSIIRKLSITALTQATVGDLTNTANSAVNNQAISVSVSYLTESTSRTFIRVSIHLAESDPDETASGRRQRKGDLMCSKNFRVTGGGGAAVTPGAFVIPANKVNLDYDHTVYVVYVQEKDCFASASRNIARAA